MQDVNCQPVQFMMSDLGGSPLTSLVALHRGSAHQTGGSSGGAGRKVGCGNGGATAPS